jgi:hypothetical protein
MQSGHRGGAARPSNPWFRPWYNSKESLSIRTQSVFFYLFIVSQITKEFHPFWHQRDEFHLVDARKIGKETSGAFLLHRHMAI